MGKLEEAKDSYAQMIEYSIKDMVYVGTQMYEAGQMVLTLIQQLLQEMRNSLRH